MNVTVPLPQFVTVNVGNAAATNTCTPMLRTKRRGLLRNVCVALGNVAGGEALPALEKAASDPEPLIAEHARWAIQQIGTRPETAQRSQTGK